MNIQVFIISWKDQHENAAFIFKQISALNVSALIIYSDPNISYKFSRKINTIKREDHLLWGDKFKACMEEAELKNTLIIHADCTSKNWAKLLVKYNDAINKIPNLAVYSPQVKFTSFPVTRTNIIKTSDDSYSIVCFIDCIVFGISADIVKRMKALDYDKNIYGWGIGWVIASYALSLNKLLIIDNTIEINHPKSRAYDSKIALMQKAIFMKQLSTSEKIFSELIYSHLRLKKMIQNIHTN